MSGEEKVPATVRGFRAGKLAQLLYAPQQKLRSGARYRLAYLATDERPWSGAPWTVLPEEPQAPRWTAAPRLTGTSYSDDFACDDSVRVTLSTPVSSQELLGVEVSLTPLDAAGAPDEGAWPEELVGPVIVPVVDGHITLGHEACLPGLDLSWSRRFRARLQLLDGSGAPADTPRAVDFDSPEPDSATPSRAYSAPRRSGEAVFDIELAPAAQPVAAEALEAALRRRLQNLDIALDSFQVEGKSIRLVVRAAADAGSWLERVLRPGQLEVALIVETPRAFGAVKLPSGVSKSFDGTVLRSTRLDSIAAAVAQLPKKRGATFRVARYFTHIYVDGTTPATAERFETILTGKSWAIAESDLADARPEVAEGLGTWLPRVNVTLAAGASKRLADKLGRRPLAVLLDGLVLTQSSFSRLPPKGLTFEVGGSTAPPPDIAAVVVRHPLPSPLVVRSIRLQGQREPEKNQPTEGSNDQETKR